MSETMSSPTGWVQFYQQDGQEVSNRVNRVVLSESMLFGDQGSADATAVSTTMITSSGAPSPLGLSGSGPASSSGAGHLSPEGRVGKPVRRRSRASRRTPTTLLNTDTTNFRAMVQQFTGGPTAPFPGAAHHSGGPNFGFSFAGRHQPSHVNHPVSGSLLVPPSAGFHLQQFHQQSQFQNQNQGYMISLNNNNNNNNNPGSVAGELFLQRFGNTRPNMEAAGGGEGGGGSTEGFVVEGVSSQVPPSSRNTFLQ